ncbi:XTP/dITP diphosphatase [Metabacillus malikii]|uniref:dITP/XTP pyrophosphatase n=1 Tax=Metabacillus malikii TaxID=1504265 RepID=A0ABT9ZGN3_9BACI|nr:XTP/dITP diphosphatase [Metabacillus malikii]MDQ0230961.1 XTP/dITP diphosphohydrolase [Metabacillus malikii]
MTEIIIATKNTGKVREFKALLEPLGYNVISLLDFTDSIDVEETGATFVENAILKAEAIANAYHKRTIADDSGLEIDYLNGEPGVYSARYAGLHKDDKDNLNKVLEKLSTVHNQQDRTARFVCALAISSPGEATKTVLGTCEGYIAEQPSGENGFGYDPIFIVKEKMKTMASLSSEEKNNISHRAMALKKLIELIK